VFLFYCFNFVRVLCFFYFVFITIFFIYFALISILIFVLLCLFVCSTSCAISGGAIRSGKLVFPCTYLGDSVFQTFMVRNTSNLPATFSFYMSWEAAAQSGSITSIASTSVSSKEFSVCTDGVFSVKPVAGMIIITITIIIIIIIMYNYLLKLPTYIYIYIYIYSTTSNIYIHTHDDDYYHVLFLIIIMYLFLKARLQLKVLY